MHATFGELSSGAARSVTVERRRISSDRLPGRGHGGYRLPPAARRGGPRLPVDQFRRHRLRGQSRHARRSCDPDQLPRAGFRAARRLRVRGVGRGPALDPSGGRRLAQPLAPAQHAGGSRQPRHPRGAGSLPRRTSQRPAHLHQHDPQPHGGGLPAGFGGQQEPHLRLRVRERARQHLPQPAGACRLPHPDRRRTRGGAHGSAERHEHRRRHRFLQLRRRAAARAFG